MSLYSLNCLTNNTYVINSAPSCWLTTDLFWNDIIDAFNRIFSFNTVTDISSCVQMSYVLPFKIPDNLLSATTQFYIGPDKYDAPSDTQFFSNYEYASEIQVAKFRFFHSTSGILNNNYLDYNSFKEYKLRLPFVGYIDVDYQFLLHDFYVEYYLDISTGGGVCNLTLLSGKIIYTFNVNWDYRLSFTGNDYAPIRDKMIGTAAAAIGSAVTIGAAGAMGSVISGSVTTSGGSTKAETLRYNRPGKSERPSKVTRTETNVEPTTVTENRTIKPATNRALANGVESLLDLAKMRSPITAFSSVTSNNCFNEPLVPFICIRGVTIMDDNNYFALVGRKLNQTVQLSLLKGYTECGSINLESDCTLEEYNEIIEYIQSGVYINNSNGTENDNPRNIEV